MEYNTQLKKIALPEYGRHIQKMVYEVMAIPDREKRNEQARAVIAVMGNLFPYLRDINDFKHKLWDHLYLISDFQIDIDSPYPKPSPITFEEKPRHVPYSSPDEIKMKHYGKGVQDMIQKIVSIEDAEVRNAAVKALANHMKKAYLAWNKDVVSDDIIFKDIEILSSGKLKVNTDLRLSVGNYNVNGNNHSTQNPSSINSNGSGNGQNRQKRQMQQQQRRRQQQGGKS
ncbi:MAG: DUF4290 domain-containing protein [Prevotellaceae bacterium]|jgi:hypothetical protein|nr:DUF4290 domain-containing protein [Prevotellaceae bacterium]